MGKGTVTREAGFLAIFSFVMIILGGQNLLYSIPTVHPSGGENGPEAYLFPGGLLTATAAIEVVTGLVTFIMAFLYLATTFAHPLLTFFSLFMQTINWFQYFVWCIAYPAYKIDKMKELSPGRYLPLSLPDQDQIGIIAILATSAYCAALQLQLMLETLEFHSANNRKDSTLPPKWVALIMNVILLCGAGTMIALESRIYDRTDSYRCVFGNCQKLPEPYFVSPVMTVYPALPLVSAIAQALLAIWGIVRCFTVSESSGDGGYSIFGPITFLVFLITLGLHVIPSLGTTTTHNWFLGWNLSAFVPFILSVAIWDAKNVVALTQDEHDFL